MSAASFLDTLKAATVETESAEADFRREVAERTKQLAQERAFAFRRFNLMRAVAEAVASAESEEIAVAASLAVVRAKIGWTNDSEARTETLAHFAPIARAVFRSLGPSQEGEPLPDVIGALSDFEAWYVSSHPAAFWVLFEQYIPETPRVDF
jgi:hypothetical protein